MSLKPVLTTFEAADLCEVSYNTIKNWIKRGLLSAYRTAGGHIRIKSDELESFSRKFAVPIHGKENPDVRKVLIVDKDELFVDTFNKAFDHIKQRLSVQSTSNAFEAGLMMEALKPDVLCINPTLEGIGPKSVARAKKHPAQKHSKVVVICETGNCDGPENSAADAIIKKNADKVEVMESIEPLITPGRGVRRQKRK